MVLVLFFMDVSIIIIIVYLLAIMLVMMCNVETEINSFFSIQKGKEIGSKVKFKVLFFNKLKIFEYDFINENQKLEFKSGEYYIEKLRYLIKNIKKGKKDYSRYLKNKIKSIDVEIKIGVKDILVTTYLVPIISTLLSIVITKINGNKTNEEAKEANGDGGKKYQVMPVYNQNVCNIHLECILNAKMIHIIYIIYKIFKRSECNG